MSFVLFNAKSLRAKEFRIPVIIAGVFIVDLLAVLFIAGNNFNQEFFGANGRATGFVAYFALIGLLVAAIISSTQFTLTRISWFLIFSGLLSTLYGILQSRGGDPFKWGGNLYSPVFGFLGNPDFQSSFVALSAVMVVAMLINKGNRKSIRVLLLVYLVAAVYVIKETKAQQGFLVFLGGIGVIVLIYVFKSKWKRLTWPMVVAGFLGLVLVVMGSLNSGPLASLLHKTSVIYRGDYWRAGWKMTLQHPVFGVGLDSYGDWYRRSRTIAATVRRGPDTISNAAHNVWLDFSSNGGFPLLIIYLALMALVVQSAFKVIRQSSEFEPIFVGLFAVWIGYQAQSIISLNQLGLAIWGWIISGLIIGYEINGRNNLEAVKPTNRNRSTQVASNLKVQPSTSLVLFMGLLIGLLVGLPPIIASSKFKSALESGDKSIIANSVNIFPRDASRTAQVAFILQQNKLEVEAFSVIIPAVKNFPDSYDLWKILSTLKNASPDQVTQAKAQMKRLDPHNPELK
jgi:O-antigen ligase